MFMLILYYLILLIFLSNVFHFFLIQVRSTRRIRFRLHMLGRPPTDTDSTMIQQLTNKYCPPAQTPINRKHRSNNQQYVVPLREEKILG